MNLQGKRLLVLGGTYTAKDIREYADKKGIILIASGDYEDHPLWKIADETYKANVKDKDALVKLIKEHNIDGVFPGGNEDIISMTIDLSEITGIPFYATRQQWDITNNKRKFKDACIKAGVPAVPEFYVSENPTREELDKVDYPVVVKPVDGSGSRGVYYCKNETELLNAIVNAKSFSNSKTIMVEKFMTGYITVFYTTIIDGKFYPASMCDKYTNPDSIMPTISQLYLYPSRNLEMLLEKYFDSIKRLYTNLGIRNGVVGIQGFCNDKEIIFTEMGYRLGGTSQQNYTNALYGYSNQDLLINYALTGRMCDPNDPCLENPCFVKKCVTLSLISTGGVVASVEGAEEVRNMPEVISCEQHYKEGDIIKKADNVNMVFFRIFLVCDDLNHVKMTVRKIQNAIKVLDDNGESILQEKFDVNRIDNTPLW